MTEEFTLAPMRRLFKKFGDLKVSEEAAEELRRVVGEYGSRIAQAAVAHAQRESRKTLLVRDVIEAKRQIEEKEVTR